MKAGRYDFSRNNVSNYDPSQYMDDDDQQMDVQQMEDDEDVPPRFAALGFEGGEWDMFVVDFPDYDPDELVQQYLEISQSEPFNTDWDTEEKANSAEYEIEDGYTKHDVAKDVMDLYYYPPSVESDEIVVKQGGKRKRRNKNKTRKTKKSKKSRKTKRRRINRQRSLRKY